MIESLPPLTSVGVLAVLAVVPIMVSWLIVLVPSKRREACGVVAGNPMETAALAPHQPVVKRPLVTLSRELTTADMGGYLLGMRHLPVEQAAPLLARYVRCADPALQLYAQSILAQSREHLQVQLVKLQRASEDDAQSAAWMLETGLALASPTLTGAAERPGFLKHLSDLAAARLKTSAATPALLSQAIQVFLEAGRPEDAEPLLVRLPQGSPLRAELEPAVAHALHQKQVA
ncbi:MAG: hypothetical protein JNM99_16015 [Verrucomicrobiaceae bacterium]|nr:hypothetical protein [Verrucomicrobiaceae bacterium]